MKPTLLIALAIFLLPDLFSQNNPSPFIGTNLTRGTNLRVLRLAVSSTGEFTQSVPGGNDQEKISEVIRQMKEWLQEINDIYGREYCVRFELIPDNLLENIIFTNAATDPWPTMSGSGCDGSSNILDIQATTIDGIIGVANYDISHVILSPSLLGGGCAGGFKTGYSGGFDLPVTRHEIGHQFSQDHTINNGGNNNFEPENAGRSIQGGNTDPYAHSRSYHELALHLITTEAATGTDVPTGNTIPTVDAGPDRTIPAITPFRLNGVATDPDAGDFITYVWDQLDGGVAQDLPTSNDTEGALFSRMLPGVIPYRDYPKLSRILNEEFATAEEDLPTQSRDLNFRLTVNDNHKFNYNGSNINASGINSDDVKVTVFNTGTPFSVTSQSTNVAYTGGSNQTITWQVGGTSLTPINTAQVKITLSADGGVSFPIVLAAATANDGSQSVTIPNINTTAARIKVEAIDNYFFDINSQDFTINQNVNIAGIKINETAPGTIVSENGQTDTYDIGLLTIPTGSVTIELDAGTQMEISLDGTNYDQSQMIVLSNSNLQTITVRGLYDSVTEGPQTGIIQHKVIASNDNTNYPIGLVGQPLSVTISDAQIPPIIGIDFDEENGNSPVNWTKVTDIRNQSLMNLSIEDGTPTGINLTTSADMCGIGGCGFSSGTFPYPQHTQALDELTGVVYARGTVTFTWSGLNPNSPYVVFIFGLGVFGDMDQSITITGDGAPVMINQVAATGTMFINGSTGTTDLLRNQGLSINSSGSGTITITVTSNLVNDEMSFAGLGLRQGTSCPESLTLDEIPISNGPYHAAINIQSKGTVQSGTNISFTAGNSIELLADQNKQFQVVSGGIFEANIGGCP